MNKILSANKRWVFFSDSSRVIPSLYKRIAASGNEIQSRPQGLLVYQNVRRHIEKREDSGASLACERETYFRWSLLSRFFLDRKYVCGSQQSQARARLGVAKNPILVPRASILLVSVVDP